jgi:hypothetical protein
MNVDADDAWTDGGNENTEDQNDGDDCQDLGGENGESSEI